MLAISKWIYVVALAVWLGAVTFFSFVVAPSVFGALPASEAGQVVAAIFPSYYRIGYASGVALVASAFFLWRRTPGASGRWAMTTGLAAIMLASVLYAGLIVQPRAHALRVSLLDPAAAPTVRAEFDQLHRRAVQLNGIVLLAGLLMTTLTAASIKP